MSGKFITFIGYPGSGKSTLRQRMVTADEIDEVISPDDIRFYDFKTQSDPKIESVIWSVVKAQMRSCLSKGKRCLLDATNLERINRQDFIAIADSFKAEKKAIVLNIDFDIAMSRNKRSPIKVAGKDVAQQVPDHVMHRMHYQWINSGMGQTKTSIKEALKDEFDEVEVINRYADKRDCDKMGGILKNDEKNCELRRETDLLTVVKNFKLR